MLKLHIEPNLSSHLPDTGIKPASPASPVLVGRFFTLSHLGSPLVIRFIFFISNKMQFILGFPDGSAGKEFTCSSTDTGDPVSIPGLGRSPGEGNGNPLWYSCLENSMDREALASYIVHGIAKRLNTFILVTGRMGGKYLAKQGMGIKMKKSKSK